MISIISAINSYMDIPWSYCSNWNLSYINSTAVSRRNEWKFYSCGRYVSSGKWGHGLQYDMLNAVIL